jgi:hypothetical protein
MPNGLAATVDFNGSAPASSSVVPLAPATNTVRFGGADGSSLILPIDRSAAP